MVQGPARRLPRGIRAGIRSPQPFDRDLRRRRRAHPVVASDRCGASRALRAPGEGAAPVIALFFGTRPQVIKASVLRGALEKIGPVAAIDTGQHYDYSLHRVHYEQLGVTPPDAYLEVGSASHARQTASILIAAEEWILAHKPDVAVVIGDTNSTLACALAAAKCRVPVAHVEAGLRAKDLLMAEEINRRCVDAIASVLLAPCARAAATLEEEQAGGAVHGVRGERRPAPPRPGPPAPFSPPP